jgi:DNA-binding transcriptional regulator/RsmH inhibitor MraZ
MAARQMPLEYLMTAKIDEKGRITVPEQFSVRTWASEPVRPLPCCDWETDLFSYRSSSTSASSVNESTRF